MATDDAADAARWRDLANRCRRLATERPATFHEALQLMLFDTVALWYAENHGLTSPGRMEELRDLMAGCAAVVEVRGAHRGQQVEKGVLEQPHLAVGELIGALVLATPHEDGVSPLGALHMSDDRVDGQRRGGG